MMVNTNFGKAGNSAIVRIVLSVVTFVFLGANLFYRFSTVFEYIRFAEGLFIFLGVCSLLVMLFPKYLRMLLFFFGASFFLFGFRPYDIQSQVFETVVVFVAITVFLVNLRRNDRSGINRNLFALISCYVGLSLFSVLLLPMGQIVKSFWMFGLKTSFLQVANTTPNTYLYPLAGINRLILFFILAFELSRTKDAREMFKWFFIGIFAGGVFSALVGLFDFYKIISLRWYRSDTLITPGSFHSTFLNRGWFAEFILIVVPFSLIGFMSKIRGLWWKILHLCALVICEIALIMSGARAGWLSYPIILFFCWLFVYFFKEGRLEGFRFSWGHFAKIALSVPVTIVLSFLLIFQVLIPLTDHFRKKPGIERTLPARVQDTDVEKKGPSGKVTPVKKPEEASDRTLRYISERAAGLADPGIRVPVWMQGVDVGREKPVFGMGYESFRWHASILPAIHRSYYSINREREFRRTNRREHIEDTPHNIFIQLFVSGGVVGLCLWFFVMGYSVIILVADLRKNRSLLNIPVLISIFSFHMYGIFQSMQYIPMIWLIVFLNLGYAMTLNDNVLPARVKKIAGILVRISVIMVIIGAFIYAFDSESMSLAEKYRLKIYAKDKKRDKYAGFYPREKWPMGYYRWSAGRAVRAVTLIGPVGVVEFDLQCHTPDVEKEPVFLSVFLNGEKIDKIYFVRKGSVKRWYYVGPKKNDVDHELLFEISRTWNPKRLGISEDIRELGLALGEMRLVQRVELKDGVRFHDWETWGRGGEIPGWPEGLPKRFRWTGMRSSIVASSLGFGHGDSSKGERKEDERVVYLQCNHPDIEKEPVVVKILGNGRLIREVRFGGRGWRKIVLGDDELSGVEVITFQVSRTWNPKRMGVSGDGRDLGVAVAF